MRVVTVTGVRQLQARLRAIGDTRPMMRTLQIATISEAQARVPRRTGHLQRSIGPGLLTDTEAQVEARTPYAATVELGSRPHVIRPKRRRVLAWPEDAADRTLAGRPRKNMKGRMVFAGKVNHPGTKPRPYLVPGAKAAVENGGFRDIVIDRWNDA
jgi:hypothetical protein